MTRKIILLFTLVAGVVAFPLAASAQSDAIPSWIKNTAGWWADDQISETEFINSMEYLIDSGIIQVSSQQNVDVTELTIGFIPVGFNLQFEHSFFWQRCMSNGLKP